MGREQGRSESQNLCHETLAARFLAVSANSLSHNGLQVRATDLSSFLLLDQ